MEIPKEEAIEYWLEFLTDEGGFILTDNSNIESLIEILKFAKQQISGT